MRVVRVVANAHHSHARVSIEGISTLSTFIIELRRSRMWIWTLVAAVAWVAIALSQREYWYQFPYRMQVWACIPATFVGPILATGAAQASSGRALSRFVDNLDFVPRRAWRSWLAFIASTALLGMLPLLAGGAIGSILMDSDAPSRNPLSLYFLATVILLLLLILMGVTLGLVTQSRVAATLLTLLLSLAISLYANPLPGNGHPWLVANPELLAFLGVLLLAFLAALTIATMRRFVARGQAIAELRRRATVWVILIAAIVACAAGVPKIPTSLAGNGAETPLCASQRVCVWPQDAPFIPVLKAQADRWAELQTRFGGDVYTVVEPGLDLSNVSQPYQIVPLDLGPDMWSTAFDMAMETYDHVTTCSVGSYGNDNVAIDMAFSDVAATYIFGAPRPGSVIAVGAAPENRVAQEIIGDVLNESPARQLAWLDRTAKGLQATCR